MNEDLTTRLKANPKYRSLVHKRRRFSLSLLALIFVAYYGYIGLIAFRKDLLAQPAGHGVVSLGIPIGFGLIILTILLTGVYVWRANGEFDRLTREIREEIDA